ncbi:hypothetical protein NLI96_g10329 [Meripilus lineatus]|uniref:Hydrophobin n=1 Tax=Meripilus lineatus TaxID=2056292 RepID=A0AAD5UZ31_9APHY|nr:hypothetical protein NLI96_g10329 [Physisporinus lineatus]
MQFKLPLIAALTLLSAGAVTAQSCDLCLANDTCPGTETCQTLSDVLGPVITVTISTTLGLLGIDADPVLDLKVPILS